MLERHMEMITVSNIYLDGLRTHPPVDHVLDALQLLL